MEFKCVDTQGKCRRDCLHNIIEIELFSESSNAKQQQQQNKQNALIYGRKCKHP